MKKLLYILSFLLFSWVTVFSQDEPTEQNDRIREKMKEFIQKRLRLTKSEADRFTPVFIRYFNEWRQTLRVHKDDRLILQQRIVELRLRFRPEFREVIGERRGNEVYKNQEIFINGLRNQQAERIKNKDDRPNKRFRTLIQ